MKCFPLATQLPEMHPSPLFITSFVHQAMSSYPLFAIRTTSDGKLGGSLETRLLIQHSM